MGGGMGAGKSTVVKEILKRYILIFDTHLARIGAHKDHGSIRILICTGEVKSAVKDKKLLSKAYLVETLLVGWYSSFWSGVAGEVVVVAADAFKETDVIYQTLQSMDDVVGTAELVSDNLIIETKWWMWYVDEWEVMWLL